MLQRQRRRAQVGEELQLQEWWWRWQQASIERTNAYLISQLDQASAAYKSSILQQSQSPTSNSAGEMSSLN